jgi:hypothetical protein
MGVQNNLYDQTTFDRTAGTGVSARAEYIQLKFNSTKTMVYFKSYHYGDRYGVATRGFGYAELSIYINVNSEGQGTLIYTNKIESSGGVNNTIEDSKNCTNPTNIRIVCITRQDATSSYSTTCTIDKTLNIYDITSNITIIPENKGQNIFIPLNNISGSFNVIKSLLNTSYQIFLSPYYNIALEDDSDRTIIKVDQYHCATLIGSTPSIYIANYYSNNLPGETTTSVTDPNKIATAQINKVNVFNVNTNSARQSGDNLCTLPTPTSGALCIVAYAGNASGKGGGNALQFTISSGKIDTIWPKSGGEKPVILCDDSNKNTGMVFVSDGTNWYIVGWYKTVGARWDNLNGTGLTTISATSYNVFAYNPLQTVSASLDRALPAYNASIGNNSYLLILKNRDIGNNEGNSYFANTTGSTPNTFNESGVNRVVNVDAGKRNYGCTWFVSEVRSGESYIHWYPVVNY